MIKLRVERLWKLFRGISWEVNDKPCKGAIEVSELDYRFTYVLCYSLHCIPTIALP